MFKRHFIFFVLCFSFSLCMVDMQAKNNRKFEKIIKAYDVAPLLKTPGKTPASFWQQIEEGHVGLNKYKHALKRKKKTAVEANYELNMALAKVETQYDDREYIDDSTTQSMLTNLRDIIEGEPDRRLQFHLVWGFTPNAYCTPRGHIYIYHTLVRAYSQDPEMLIGVCAHEAAHYYLMHSARHLWAEKRNERKNNILAGISIGMMAFADGMAAGNAAYYGQSYQSNLAPFINSVLYCTEYDNIMYHFRYGREQELEADMVAYRFLEYVGLDPKMYVRALVALGIENDTTYDEQSDHPSISYRVDFLTYLGEHYPLKFVGEGK